MPPRKKTDPNHGNVGRSAAPQAMRPDSAGRPFLIVGVGASAGGLEAVTELLRNIPEECGIAFVLVQHLDPTHSSMLDQILGRATRMPVHQVEDNIRVQPGQVYIIPPNTELDIEHGVLRLSPREAAGRGMAMPVDHFLRSLAKDQGSQAVAVILSGTASDGSLGTKAIKSEGGIVFAQDESARYDGMPRAAKASGSVDFVMSPPRIAEELLRIAKHPYTRGHELHMALGPEELTQIFSLLRIGYGVDFTQYKPNTIERRIRRRMAVHHSDDLEQYLSLLRVNPRELEELYHDILIRVTGFFRDPDVFEFLKSSVFPDILKNRNEEGPVRIWVPGCSTGEEAYSLAISFLEIQELENQHVRFQVFGTDVSERSINAARAAAYPAAMASDMSRERLRKFFTSSDGQYRVTKEVRDSCVFARQNVTRDPPFSRLDLVSCRNVMIYLGTALQRKVISIFHYALKPSGILLLGSSESIGSFTDLFEVLDRKNKVYRKRLNALRQVVELGPPQGPGKAESPRPAEEPATANLIREADRVLLNRYAPPGVVANDKLEIVQFRGRTSPFLEPAPGTATFDLLKMAREGLLSVLRSAIDEARKSEVPVRAEGAVMNPDGQLVDVRVQIIPFFSADKERFFIVLFEQVGAMEQTNTAKRKSRTAKSGKPNPPADARLVMRLRNELEATREYLHSIIEEQEAMNEQLRSANEEIQSSNEELQSTNEEMETAKEELQSSNEELITLNEELENRNSELAVLNNDLQNILGSVDIAILLLDENLRIRRINTEAQRALKLLATDVGRPITDLKTSVGFEGLEKLVAATIDTLTMQEVEVQDRNGARFSLRIRPYKTTDNRIEGAVLTLIDVTRFQAP